MTATQHKKIYVAKESGKRMVFLSGKLKRSGADEALCILILNKILAEVYDGISTQEIYKRAFQLLRYQPRQQTARYKLKNCNGELGPSRVTM